MTNKLPIEEIVQTPDAFEHYLQAQVAINPNEEAGWRGVRGACPIRNWLAELYPEYSRFGVNSARIVYDPPGSSRPVYLEIGDTWISTFVQHIDAPYDKRDQATWFASYQEALDTLHNVLALRDFTSDLSS